jgi:hypothetical protein
MATRTSVVLGSAVAGIVVLGAVAGVVAGRTTASQRDPATPTGAVQAYLQAIVKGDVDAAAARLSPDGTCTVADHSGAGRLTPLRPRLVTTSITGDSAVVQVDVTEGSGDELFGSSGYAHTERFLLARTGATWSLTGTPWPMFECTGSTP